MKKILICSKVNIQLHKPTLEELWFREKCMSDPKTMKYNAGYDLNYNGYHRDTGCIDFPKENWQKWYNTKMNNSNFFYAYIVDCKTKNFVGYVNFNKDPKSNKATMGIVIKSEYQGQGYMRPAMVLLIEKAKEYNINYLTDTVPENRKNALKVFYDLGFVKIKEFESKKFNEIEIIAEIEKKID